MPCLSNERCVLAVYFALLPNLLFSLISFAYGLSVWSTLKGFAILGTKAGTDSAGKSKAGKKLEGGNLMVIWLCKEQSSDPARYNSGALSADMYSPRYHVDDWGSRNSSGAGQGDGGGTKGDENGS